MTHTIQATRSLPTESTACFGTGQRLVGTLARPAQPVGTLPCLLLLNAGVIGRAGPHRMNVRLARTLAEQGFSSFRFDLSGLGDSARATSSVPHEQQAIEDIRQAMDHVQAMTGACEFVLIGFCSGADNGYHAAQQDSRLRGLIMFDPYAYPDALTQLIRICVRIQDDGPIIAMRRWLERKKSTLAHKAAAPSDAPALQRDSSRMVPPQTEYANTLQSLLQQGVAIYLIHSGSGLHLHNHRWQFKWRFWRWPDLRQIQCDHLPLVDHALGERRGQELLIARIGDWLGERYGSRPAKA